MRLAKNTAIHGRPRGVGGQEVGECKGTESHAKAGKELAAVFEEEQVVHGEISV
jgi:hypothetical protein